MIVALRLEETGSYPQLVSLNVIGALNLIEVGKAVTANVEAFNLTRCQRPGISSKDLVNRQSVRVVFLN